MRSLLRVVLAASPVLVLSALAISGTPQGDPHPTPQPRQIPGVTAPDQFKRACVDCHVNRPDLKMDVRLSTVMRQWDQKVDPALLARVRGCAPVGMTLTGKHPKIDVAAMEIPKGCLGCHSSTSKAAPPFSRLLHRIHLVGGEKNHFVTMFQGECTHCHKLDPATGAWSVGSGKEAR